MELVCSVIFCAFCCYHLLLFPQCSLVLLQPVSKDVVKLFDDVVFFKILACFYIVANLCHMMCISCAKAMFDSWQVHPNLLRWQWVPDLIARPRRAPAWYRYGALVCYLHTSASCLIWIQSADSASSITVYRYLSATVVQPIGLRSPDRIRMRVSGTCNFAFTS